MKQFLLTSLGLLLVALSCPAQSTLTAQLEQLNGLMKPVIMIDKDEISQQLRWDSTAPWRVRFEVQTGNSKSQKSERYEVNLGDFNPFLVTRQSKDKYQGVQCRTEKENNFIGYWEDGKQGNYRNTLMMYFPDASTADEAVKILKTLARDAKEQWEKSLRIPDGLAATFDFVAQQITSVETGDKTVKQSLEHDPTFPDRAVLKSEIVGKSTTESERLAWSWGDLNHLNVVFKTSGKQLYVEMETRRKQKFVEAFKNDQPNGYDDALRILVRDPDAGKVLVRALEKIIPLGEKELTARLSKVATFADGIKLLGEQTQPFSANKYRYEQQFKPECLTTYTITRAKEEGGEKEETLRRFHFADLHPNTVELEISSREIIVGAGTAQKANLIETQRTGETAASYTDDFEIPAGSIESARMIQHLLPQLIALCPQQVQPETFDWLTGALGDMPSLKERYVVSLKRAEADKECSWVLTATTISEKKSVEDVYEFDLDRLDPKGVKFEAKGKNIGLVLPMRFGEKVVKHYKAGKQDFTNKIEIPLDSIEKAKKAAKTVQDLAQKCGK
jgi:hypothetical protein